MLRKTPLDIAIRAITQYTVANTFINLGRKS